MRNETIFYILGLEILQAILKFADIKEKRGT
jgi:hypothetical protein